jgi:hypothetical protein
MAVNGGGQFEARCLFSFSYMTLAGPGARAQEDAEKNAGTAVAAGFPRHIPNEMAA